MLMKNNLTALIFYGTMGNSFRICMGVIIWYKLEICICSPNESKSEEDQGNILNIRFHFVFTRNGNSFFKKFSQVHLRGLQHQKKIGN